jgi:hypothetical protein
MSVSANLILLAQAIAADVKALSAADGDLATLTTTAKGNLVAALNEVHALALAGGGGVQINDAAGNGDVDVVWSADKVFDSIEAAKTAVKNELLDGAGAAYDTFKELQDLLVGQDDAVAALTTAVGNRLRFDQAQVLTSEQQAFARDNIGAAEAADLATLVAAVGNTEEDLVAAYNLAKA